MSSYVSALTNEEIARLRQQDGAGERDSIQRHCSGAAVYTPIVQQPDQPTAQTEIHRPAVSDDSIMTLNKHAQRGEKNITCLKLDRQSVI